MKTEKANEKLNEKMVSLMSQQERAIANLLNPAQYLKSTYELIDLPLFGKDVPHYL